MKIKEITTVLVELRTNPKQNSKISEMDQLNQALEKNGGKMDNLFVRFTDDNKLGINPQHSYATPFGICAYPFEYVYKRNLNVPFAGDRKFVVIFTADDMSNALDLQNTPLQKARIKIINAAAKVIDNDESKELVKYNITSSRKLWYKIYNIVRSNSETPREEGITMMKILKTAGYNMVVDHGDGIIHKTEPAQTIFLSKSGLTIEAIIERRRIENDNRVNIDTYVDTDTFKYQKSSNPTLSNDALVKQDPRIVLSMKKPTKEQIEIYYNWAIDNMYAYKWNKNRLPLPHKYQILLVKKDPNDIQYLDNPPATVQQAAVLTDYMSLFYIQNTPDPSAVNFALHQCNKELPGYLPHFISIIERRWPTQYQNIIAKYRGNNEN